MKSKKILTVFVGIAIVAAIILSGIIIGTNIRKEADASRSQPEEIHSYVLEKTSLEEFSEISISLSYANISILPSDGYYLEYRLDGTCTEPVYSVSDGKFQFQEGNVQGKYMIRFGISSHEPFFLNLYVPADKYFDLLAISDESGNVTFEEILAKKAELTLNYGNLEFESFTGDTLHLTMDSGNLDFGSIYCKDVTLENSYGSVTGDIFTASTSASIELDSGNWEVRGVSADKFSLTNAYGNTDIYNFTSSDSTFSIDSGNLSLMNTDFKNLGIDCEYGDVDLELRQTLTDYSYDLSTDYGNIYVDNKRIEPNDEEETVYKKDNEKDRKMEIFCDSGSITVTEK